MLRQNVRGNKEPYFEKKISPAGWYALGLLAAALILLVCLIIVQNSAVNTVVHVDTQADNIYDKTITVVADCDYDPYSFFDDDGNPSGHDVELINGLANRMGYNVELKLLPWPQAIQAAENGDADLVMAMYYTEKPINELNLSVPLTNDPFVAFGREGFTRIGELYDKRLAVLAGTGCLDRFVKPYHLSANTTEYSSVSEVFEAVNAGRADYAIVRFSVGRRAMANGGYSGITAVGPTLLNNYMCIGISSGNSILAQQLDNAIINASSDGTLAALSSKWLGRYVDTLSLGEFISANIGALLIIASVLLLILFLGILLINKYMSRSKEMILTHLAQRDQLTGLYNRATGEGFIKSMLAGSDPGRDVHALLVMDVDNFKLINDTFGHLEGDAALISLADTLRRIFRQSDITGRLGGDEFYVFMPNCASVEVPMEKAGMICRLFSKTREIGGVNTNMSASVGIAVYPGHGQSFAELYKNADDALYESKRRGKNGYSISDDTGNTVFYPNSPQ